MDRHSSDSDDNSRSKRKKKQRHRSSRSRDRSSSSPHTSSRKRRSWSTEREQRMGHCSYKSPGRDRRSHSRHRRSRSRSDSRSHRRSRRRSHSREQDRSRRRAHDKEKDKERTRGRDRDKERTRGRDRDKDREKDKAKEKAQKKAEAMDLKARLEHLTPAEQARVRMQLVLEAAVLVGGETKRVEMSYRSKYYDGGSVAKDSSPAADRAAKTDEVLRAKVAMREDEARKKLEEEGTSVEDQVRRIKDIEAIESDSFVPQAFKSSRDDIKVEPIVVKQESQSCSQDVSLPISIIYNDTDTLAHPSLFLDKEKAEELWLNRLVSLRQERLMGSPVS